MIGEIWETIIDGISTAWDSLMEVPEMFSGFFSEVNFFGWFVLSMIAEVVLWGFWYYATYVKEIGSFFDWKTMIIATVVAPIIAYIFAWRASRQ